MAYLVGVGCAGRCGKKAVSVRVYGRYNNEEGLFCVTCGQRRLAALLRIETENDQAVAKRLADDGPEAAEKLRGMLR